MQYEAGTPSPRFSPTFHVRSATIAAHRGQLAGSLFAQNRRKMAERMRFELTIGFPLYALSRGDLRSRKHHGYRVKALIRQRFPQFSPVFGYSQAISGVAA